MQTVERTDVNYLRPNQVVDMQREEQTLNAKLESKHIEDKGAVSRQLRALRQSLETQMPHAPETSEHEGILVRRERELLEQIVPMMCSQAEMRANPPGAVGKFNAGENSRRGKTLITEWKNIRLRLNPGSTDPDIANLERYRPTSSTLNLDTAQVQLKSIFLPPANAALPVAFTAEQLDVLSAIAPDIRERLATLDNVQRADVRDLIETAKGGIGLADERSPKSIAQSEGGKLGAAKKKRIMSPEQLANLQAGRAAAAAKRAADKPSG